MPVLLDWIAPGVGVDTVGAGFVHGDGTRLVSFLQFHLLALVEGDEAADGEELVSPEVGARRIDATFLETEAAARAAFGAPADKLRRRAESHVLRWELPRGQEVRVGYNETLVWVGVGLAERWNLRA
ncbi:hypothetical protein AAEX63_08655 [Luteococcus sp. H138]|uniref:hypothetical protein n=1 Tax=unclassified Luteococcus TaxID=2639923 RepID=UPI00313DB417